MTTGESQNSGAEAPQIHFQQPIVRPTHDQVRLIQVMPQSSPLLREWLGAEDGQIVIDLRPPDAPKNAFTTGRVVDAETQDTRFAFKYRAEQAGRVGRVVVRAANWLLDTPRDPKGWLEGSVSLPVGDYA